MKNYGWVEPIITDDNYVLGGGYFNKKVLMPTGHGWGKYLPNYEPQFNEEYDTYGCTVWGTENIIETIIKFRFGYEPNYSERYIYILAGITPPGADVHYVSEIIRKYGLVDNSILPMTASYKEFLRPNPMTAELLLKGREWKEKYELKHEWLWGKNLPSLEERGKIIKEALKYGPVGVSVTAWYKDGDVYVDRGLPNSHWVELYDWDDTGWLIFDSYDHSHKTLSFDHNFKYAKGYFLLGGVELEEVKRGLTLEALGKIKVIISWINGQLNDLKKTLIMETPSEKLYRIAFENIGKDLSPTQNELGCVETVCTLRNLAFGDNLKLLGTPQLYKELVNNPKWQKVSDPKPGDLILSVTGTGNGKIKNGHVGVVGKVQIMSNNSKTSKLDTHLTLEWWKHFYRDIGGMEIHYFRRIA